MPRWWKQTSCGCGSTKKPTCAASRSSSILSAPSNAGGATAILYSEDSRKWGGLGARVPLLQPQAGHEYSNHRKTAQKVATGGCLKEKKEENLHLYTSVHQAFSEHTKQACRKTTRRKKEDQEKQQKRPFAHPDGLQLSEVRAIRKPQLQLLPAVD